MTKIELEYPCRSSVKILFTHLSSPSGLSEWFADDVNLKDKGKIYSFIWDGNEQNAVLLAKKDNRYIKFRWEDEPDNTFFEFRIVIDDLTEDVSLMITDFVEESEVEETTLLWDSQVKDLLQAVGG